MPQVSNNEGRIAPPPGKLRKQLLVLGLILLLGFAGWGLRGAYLNFQAATLKTTFSRLSSTIVDFSIPEPGKLHIKAGPTAFLGEAQVFSLVLASEQATPMSDPPFEVSAPYLVVFNKKNPDNPKELVLTLLFPSGHFNNQEKFIARVPFSTTQEGQFEVKSVFFGSL